jgi:MoaA/NifB/PqqE/SkfB family radical SAM enzyme
MVVVAPDGRSLWSLEQSRPVAPQDLFLDRPWVFLINAAFVLEPPVSVADLVEAARGGAGVLGVLGDGRFPSAAVLRRSSADHPECMPALSRLVSQAEEPGTPHRPGRPSALSAHYLNAALAELLAASGDDGPTPPSPERMRQALFALRDRSAVPWVFNALVNEIEHRLGRPVVDSFPPELHLSLTGRCNIECRFCSYTHDNAYADYVDVPRVARLDFLRHLHTLRLSSGLGEPTLNPHLPAIIEYLSRRFPHLAMNFFTNGVALPRRGLTDALVDRVSWMNVSLNAATRRTWQALCLEDLFDRVADGLRQLHEAKRSRGASRPVVYGSMVLTRTNLHELPRMPELCRSLGVDRFTAIPFFAYRFAGTAKYGADESLHRGRDLYEPLYHETVAQARLHRVSLELPPPEGQKRSAFGVEVRSFYDFAGIEETPHRLALLVDDLAYDSPAAPSCGAIWKIAHVGSRDRTHAATAGTHFLYPCLGPLATADFSTRTAFDFPDGRGFLELWNNPVFVKLRAAQRWCGISPICDTCRGMDSRDPANFSQMDALLDPWKPAPTFIPAADLTLRRA